MDSDTIRVRREGAVGLVTIDRRRSPRQSDAR
jgi:hypothetical protein